MSFVSKYVFLSVSIYEQTLLVNKGSLRLRYKIGSFRALQTVTSGRRVIPSLSNTAVKHFNIKTT